MSVDMDHRRAEGQRSDSSLAIINDKRSFGWRNSLAAFSFCHPEKNWYFYVNICVQIENIISFTTDLVKKTCDFTRSFFYMTKK